MPPEKKSIALSHPLSLGLPAALALSTYPKQKANFQPKNKNSETLNLHPCGVLSSAGGKSRQQAAGLAASWFQVL